MPLCFRQAGTWDWHGGLDIERNERTINLTEPREKNKTRIITTIKVSITHARKYLIRSVRNGRY